MVNELSRFGFYPGALSLYLQRYNVNVCNVLLSWPCGKGRISFKAKLGGKKIANQGRYRCRNPRYSIGHVTDLNLAFKHIKHLIRMAVGRDVRIEPLVANHHLRRVSTTGRDQPFRQPMVALDHRHIVFVDNSNGHNTSRRNGKAGKAVGSSLVKS